MMHKTRSVNNSYVLQVTGSLSVTILFLSLCMVIDYYSKGWPEGFTRPADGTNYLVLYFIFLWCFLAFCQKNIFIWSIKKQIIIGLIAGQLLSMIALNIVAHIYFDNPLERWSNTINNFGLAATLAVGFAASGLRSIALGGWLFGLLAMPLARTLQIQFSKYFTLHHNS